jgi:hypothetical protein
MIFAHPTPFTEALRKLAGLDAMPTDLGSADLRKLDAGLRERSLFSARTNSAGYLQEVRDQLASLLGGETNMATARAALQDKLDALGYHPERGFSGEENTHIPPAGQGALQDLSSNGRLQLMLETNMRQVANFGYREQGNTSSALFQFPCWELVRLYPREVPRGEKVGKGGAVEPDPENAWTARWQEAGGTLTDGRMIARKDDPIWEELGESGTFPDALDTAYPPFAFNSGMGWRQVPREECLELGVIEADEQVQPGAPIGMNDELKAGSGIDADFLRALKSDLGGEIKSLRGGGAQLANRALRTRAERLLSILSPS